MQEIFSNIFDVFLKLVVEKNIDLLYDVFHFDLELMIDDDD
jgi:hypothetical protein